MLLQNQAGFARAWPRLTPVDTDALPVEGGMAPSTMCHAFMLGAAI